MTYDQKASHVSILYQAAWQHVLVIQPSVCFIVPLQFMVLVVISESSAGEELQKLQQISVSLQPSSSTGQLTHFSCPFRTRCSDMNHCIRASLLIMNDVGCINGNGSRQCSHPLLQWQREQCLDSDTEE